jgi:hypothetical protein
MRVIRDLLNNARREWEIVRAWSKHEIHVLDPIFAGVIAGLVYPNIVAMLAFESIELFARTIGAVYAVIVGIVVACILSKVEDGGRLEEMLLTVAGVCAVLGAILILSIAGLPPLTSAERVSLFVAVVASGGIATVIGFGAIHVFTLIAWLASGWGRTRAER